MTKTHGWSGWCLTGRCKDCAYPGCGHDCHTQVEGQGELLPDPRTTEPPPF